MNYIFVHERKSLKEIPEKNGFYKIYALNKKGKPRSIRRVLGNDKEGIIYIGCAPKQTLKKRLDNFRLCVVPGYKTTNHSGGKRYKSLKAFQEEFPYKTLAVTYQVSNKSKQREKAMLEEYSQQYGEVPPLNNSS